MQLRVEKLAEDTKADVICSFGMPKTLPAHALAQGYTGEAGKAAIVPSDDARFLWTLHVGRGEGREGVREAVGNALALAGSVGASTVAFFMDGGAQGDIQAAVEAVLFKSYRYAVYKEGPKRAVSSVTFLLQDARARRAAVKGIARGEAIMRGVTLARDLVNAPPKDVHPEELAQTAKRIAAQSKGRVKVKVLEREECEKRGMGAYLAVAQGSAFPPKFIHLTYTPPKKTKKKLAIVGKGITFDSGGLSLKPADAMMTMKCDMGGAAAVLGMFATLAALAPRVEVHGIIAAAENMPSGNAMRPGDIVRASNGKTIEILNTDAEGRLTLADALHYANALAPQAIVDLATLTGACVVALGEEITGVMSNDDDVAVALLAAAERAGEKMWEMPLEKRYRSLVESDVADLRNIATSRYGGSLTAGLFLQEFVGKTPWAHLDIAGPAFAERPMSSYIGKGGTGHGVRTLIEFVEKYEK